MMRSMKIADTTKRVLALLLLLCTLFAFVSCGETPSVVPDDPPVDDGQEETPAEPYTVTYTLTVKSAKQHTDEQAKYLSGSDYNAVPNDSIHGTSEKGRPQAVALAWTTKQTGGFKTLTYTAVLDEDENFTNPKRYQSTNNRAEFKNLKIGTTYYWYVEGVSGNSVYRSEVASFVTDAAAPRNLDIGGISNCRDLGGWKTSDGGTVKQGMIFRTSKLNDGTNVTVNSSGKEVLLEELGIKAEIDLRLVSDGENGGITSCLISDSVKYYSCPMDYHQSDNILKYNPEMVVKVFEILGDESNYPLIFHCKIGTDRTGMVAFLINGILGVSEKDLYRDYLFSNFGSIGSERKSSRLTTYLDMVKEKPGATLAEQIENYLLDIGVAQEDIDTVKRLMK